MTITRGTTAVLTSATVGITAVLVVVLSGHGTASQTRLDRGAGQPGLSPVANGVRLPHKAALPHVSAFAHLGAVKPGEVRKEEVGAAWEPAPADARPAVAAARAISAAGPNLSVMSTRAKTPTARLVMYQNVFGEVQADGTMKPSVPRQIAWLVESTGTGVIAHSRPAGGSPAPSPPSFTCSFTVVISAKTGERLDGFRIR